MSSNLFKLSIILVFLLTNVVVYGQYIAKIEFDKCDNKYGMEKKNQRGVRKSKSFLKKHLMYSVLDDKEVDIEYVNDTMLNIDYLTEKQINYLQKQEFILVEFKSKNSCYYSLFPNAFSSRYYKSIRSLVIYDATKKKVFVRRKRKRYAMNFTYYENGMSFNIPLSLIPCSEYQGEYDRGIPKGE